MLNGEQEPASHSEERLASLFAAYREALPDPDASPEFMPRLWEKIEARQTFAGSIRLFARAIITAAATASLVMGIYMTRPQQHSFYTNTYLELLAADQTHESLGDAEIVQASQERNQ